MLQKGQGRRVTQYVNQGPHYFDLMFMDDPQGPHLVPNNCTTYTLFINEDRQHKRLKEALLTRLKSICEALAT